PADANPWRDYFSALARDVLHGVDAVSGLLEIWRRIQGDGACGVRPAGISRRISPHRARGWAAFVPLRPGIFHAPESGRGDVVARRQPDSGARAAVLAISGEAAWADAQSGGAPRAAPS